MKRIPVCKEAELLEGAPRSVRIFAKEVAVFRHGPDIYARESACKHMGASLARSGKWKGSRVTCAWHGWEYDMISGQCLGKPDIRLKPYPTDIEDGIVYVLIDI